MTSREALKKHFGYDAFRGGQEELIHAVLDKKDVLGIMPTGAGKSICFQLPALMQEGITLVVSPLISLMKDQVGALVQSGIPAAYLNSTLSPRQLELALHKARNGAYKLIYVAPERLLSPDFLDFARNANISMLAVDEAHCISQWGQDFRPSYAQIPMFIEALPKHPVVSAFTATATLQVREDILRLLSLQAPAVFVTGFDRDNLYFEVQSPRDKMAALLDFLRENPAASGIIYGTARKTVEEVCERLNSLGLSASLYHAGLSDGGRHKNQDDFLYDRVQLMVATNAFGMGIDKSNVAFVVHYNMPRDLESYYQEAGRAGRDGNPARCLLFYSGQDVRTNQWMIENDKDISYPDPQTERLLKERGYKRLRDMTFYATTNDCLRGFILRYFGERPPGFCGYCGNCDTKFETVDVTEEAQKILSCVHRLQGRFGASIVVDVLRGGKSKRIQELGLDKLPSYGSSQKSAHFLRALINQLLENDYLGQSEGQYPVLRLTPKSNELLAPDARLEMKLPAEKEARPEKMSAPTGEVPSEQRELLARLRRLRSDLAAEQGVPAYVVFSDRSLADMCLRLPQTPQQFATVFGVGEAKLARYGEAFLREIAAFASKHSEETQNPVSDKKKREPAAPVLPTEEVLALIEVSPQASRGD